MQKENNGHPLKASLVLQTGVQANADLHVLIFASKESNFLQLQTHIEIGSKHGQVLRTLLNLMDCPC